MTWMDQLRGLFVKLNGVLVGARRVGTLNIITGTGLGAESSFDERTGHLSVTIAAEGTTLDAEISTSDRLLGRDTAGAGAAEEIGVGGGIEFTGSKAIQRSALTGAITAAAGSNVTALGNNVVLLDNLDSEVTDLLGGSISPLSRVLFVDSNSAVTPADGSIGAPFTTVQAAHDAATAGSTIRIIAFTAGGGLTITKDIVVAADRVFTRKPFGGSYARAGENVSLGAITITGTPSVTLAGVNVSTIAGTGSINLTHACDISGAITGGLELRASDTDFGGDIALDFLSVFSNCRFQTGVDITSSATSIEMQGCRFSGTVSIVFSGSAGVVTMDEVSAHYWAAATETLTNGSITLIGGAPSGAAGGSLTGTYPNPTIANEAVTLSMMANISSDRLLGRDTAGLGQPEELELNGGIEFTGGGGIRRSALTGDVTASAGSNACTIAANAVTLGKLATIATDRLLGRDAASTGDVEVLTVGGGVEFTGSGGIQRSALTGDVTCSAGSSSTTIAANAVTLAKMQQITTDRLLGRDTPGTGNVEEIALGSSLAFNGTGALVRAALDGDVTAPLASNTTTIANDAVTNAKAADMAEATIKGRAAGAGTGDPTDLTAAQVKTLLAMTLAEILAVSNTTGANNLLVNAAQVLQLVAGTPTTAGPANAALEFLREGGGTSSTIALGTSNLFRVRSADSLEIDTISEEGAISIASGTGAVLNLTGGDEGVNIGATSTGRVEITQLGFTRFSGFGAHGSMGSTEEINWATTGFSWHTGTLSANCTFTFLAPEGATDMLYLQLTQDVSGGRTITWPASVANAAAINAALATTGDSYSIIRFVYTGVVYVGQVLGTGLV